MSSPKLLIFRAPMLGPLFVLLLAAPNASEISFNDKPFSFTNKSIIDFPFGVSVHFNT